MSFIREPYEIDCVVLYVCLKFVNIVTVVSLKNNVQFKYSYLFNYNER